MNKYTDKQERLSHEDALRRQQELLQFLRNKVQNPIISQSEANKLPEMVAKALLSSAINTKLDMNINGRTVILGTLHAQLLQMNEWARKDVVQFESCGRIYTIRTSDLWKRILQKVTARCPVALSEALQSSREMPKREGASSFKFSMDKKI